MATDDFEQPEAVHAGEQRLGNRRNQPDGPLRTIECRDLLTVHARVLRLEIHNDGHREVEKFEGGEKNVLVAHYEPKALADIIYLLRPQRHVCRCRRICGVAQF